MAKLKTQYHCQNCGYRSVRWLGRCPECAEWGGLVEETAMRAAPAGALLGAAPVPISSVSADGAPRLASGIDELDRVRGGGVVPGALVLLGGDPGIGKSTLLLQALDGWSRLGPVLYVSGA